MLIPRGSDVFKLKGKRGIKPLLSPRLTLFGKEVFLLNPLNPNSQVLTTSVCFGDVPPKQYKQTLKKISNLYLSTKKFALIGGIYSIAGILLCFLSYQVPFIFVLMVFLIVHLVFWLICIILLFNSSITNFLKKSELISISIEALLVPAHIMNLPKKIYFKVSIDVPSVGFSLRELKGLPDEEERQYFTRQLIERIYSMSASQGIDFDELDQSSFTDIQQKSEVIWLKAVKSCLKI